MTTPKSYTAKEYFELWYSYFRLIPETKSMGEYFNAGTFNELLASIFNPEAPPPLHFYLDPSPFTYEMFLQYLAISFVEGVAKDWEFEELWKKRHNRMQPPTGKPEAVDLYSWLKRLLKALPIDESLDFNLPWMLFKRHPEIVVIELNTGSKEELKRAIARAKAKYNEKQRRKRLYFKDAKPALQIYRWVCQGIKGDDLFQKYKEEMANQYHVEEDKRYIKNCIRRARRIISLIKKEPL